jgi:glycosyltransferase involved in cell wall biosynthesis
VTSPPPGAPKPQLRVGFVGRVVPIKDLVTFIRACDMALNSVDIDARVIGPAEEDPGYAARCRQLVARLGRTNQIRFVGPMPPDRIYGDLDVVVLTSFSEGQPLVILEAYAWGVPVVATEVGACREMIEGPHRRGPGDRPQRFRHACRRAQGDRRRPRPAGARRAAALAHGRRRHQRVTAFYQRHDMLARYRALYTSADRRTRSGVRP